MPSFIPWYQPPQKNWGRGSSRREEGKEGEENRSTTRATLRGGGWGERDSRELPDLMNTRVGWTG
jgi:hypothetical protein